MALPMQASAAMAQAPTMMVQQPPQPSMSPWGQTSNPTAARRLRGAGAARPPTARDHQPRRVLLEHGRGSAGRDGRDPDGRAAERARVDAVGASGTSGRPGARRPPTDSRRRPAVAQMQSPRPADELGVEESEFDKPTYLRRGLYAPE